MPERDLHEFVLPGSVSVDERHLDLGRQLQANVGADLGSADAQASQQSQQFLVREGGEAVVGHQATLGEAEALRDFLDEKGLRLLAPYLQQKQADTAAFAAQQAQAEAAAFAIAMQQEPNPLAAASPTLPGEPTAPGGYGQ